MTVMDSTARIRKPSWLLKKVNPGEQSGMLNILSGLRLNTVCQQARCPNISECFSCGQVTFLILGNKCTRMCSFCNVTKHAPETVDHQEPCRVAEAVVRLGLSHVVITSPTRDDLEDGGAGHFASAISAVMDASPRTTVEVLIPDFQGKLEALEAVLNAGPDIVAHNMETIQRLYYVRSGADYGRSLELLRRCKEQAPGISTKSGVMLGLGETEKELLELFADLRRSGCDYLSIGQYLAPSRQHYPVKEYVLPERFECLRTAALEAGFSHVESGPYVRSSYHAALYR
jgi:lipoyl synthase